MWPSFDKNKLGHFLAHPVYARLLAFLITNNYRTLRGAFWNYDYAYTNAAV